MIFLITYLVGFIITLIGAYRWMYDEESEDPNEGLCVWLFSMAWAFSVPIMAIGVSIGLVHVFCVKHIAKK